MAGLKNIIRKQTVHFQYNGRADGFALQKEVGDWCTHVLMPQLEQQLEKYCLPNWHLSLDKIEVNAAINETNWQEKIQQQVMSAIQERLAQEQAVFSLSTEATREAVADQTTISATKQLKGKPVALDKEQPNQMLQQALLQGQTTKENVAETTEQAVTPEQQQAPSIALEQKKEALVLFFLQKGYLPWWSDTVPTGPFTQFVQQWLTGTQTVDVGRPQQVQKRIQQLVQQLKPVLSPAITTRLVNHLPGSSFFTFARLAFPQAAQEVDNTNGLFTLLFSSNKLTQAKYQNIAQPIYRYWLAEHIQNVDAAVIPTMLEQLYQTIYTAKPSISTTIVEPITISQSQQANPIITAWQQLVAQKAKASNKEGESAQPTAKAKPSQKTKTSEQPNQEQPVEKEVVKEMANKPLRPTAQLQELEEGIYIENAGAVIVALFLPTLFSKLKLASNGVLLKPNVAAVLIQYMVTGNIGVTEPELVLPKILCGIELEEAVNTNHKITAQQKKEITDMLASAISHWSILKNTSVQGLQEAFLQRSGKLRLVNNQWVLQVEQKSYDMLLQQLPWNIAMIKLPWMKQLLKTEWI